MLSNAYFLAKFGFDTAENEPAKNLQNCGKFANFADPNPLTPLRVRSPGAAEVRIAGTPLYTACEHGHLAIAKCLFAHGADIDGRCFSLF